MGNAQVAEQNMIIGLLKISTLNLTFFCKNDQIFNFILQAVERRGEMIVRNLEPRCIGGRHAVEAAQKLLSKGDARHTVQVISI